MPGHQHSAWQSNPRHLNPNIIVLIYTMCYPCWVITLFDAVAVMARGRCWCPREHLFCAWASAFGMTIKSATSESKYCCSHIYHMLYLLSAKYKSKHYCFIYTKCDTPIEVDWHIKALIDRSSLVHMVACLSGTKPLFEPILAYEHIQHLSNISIVLDLKFEGFYCGKWIWECRLQNGGYFVSASMC